MGRYMTQTCPNCKARYSQDWEEPDECPYCDVETEPEECEPDREHEKEDLWD
jgi:hypothetical protein